MGFKFLFHVAAVVLLQILVVAEDGAFLALRGSQMERMLEDATTSTLNPTSTSTIEETEEEVVEEVVEEVEEEVVVEADDIIFDDDLVDTNVTDGNVTDGNSTITDDDEVDDAVVVVDDDDEIAFAEGENPLNNGGDVLAQIQILIKSLQRTSSLNRDEEASTQSTEKKSIFLARQDAIRRTVPNDMYVRN